MKVRTRKTQPPPHHVQKELDEVVLQLKQVQSAVVVAALALRQQASELDEDIANVLQQSIGNRLQDQVEKLEALQKALDAKVS
jgi:hypothetical protein